MPKVEQRRLSNGDVRYFVRFTHPTTRKQTSRAFTIKRQAEAFARNLDRLGAARTLAETEAVIVDTSVPTLDEWAERHFASLTGVTAGTLVTYRRVYARCWQTPLGQLRLTQITREQVAHAVNDLSGADKTIRNAHGVLAAMIKTAVRDGLITRNPCEGMRLPRRTEHEKTEHRYLTQDEFGALIVAIPDHWQPLVWILAGTGMRWGEAEALTVGDVDLAAATVRITKSVKWDASKATREVGPPKTKRSRRTVTLPDQVVDAVRPLTVGRKKGERLILAPRGGQLRHPTFWYDVWRKAVARAGMDPPPRIHDLRHSHVAWLIGAGVPLPVIQARLGHESITTTINVYGHLLPDLQRQAADAAAAVMPTVRLRVEPPQLACGQGRMLKDTK